MTPPATGPQDTARAARAARRAFVREHHPDRGGDPVAFVRGLEHHAVPGPGAGAGSGPVVVIRRRSPRARVVAAVVRRLRPPPPRVR